MFKGRVEYLSGERRGKRRRRRAVLIHE